MFLKDIVRVQLYFLSVKFFKTKEESKVEILALLRFLAEQGHKANRNKLQVWKTRNIWATTYLKMVNI